MREQATVSLADVRVLIRELSVRCKVLWNAGQFDEAYSVLLVIEGLAKRIP